MYINIFIEIKIKPNLRWQMGHEASKFTLNKEKKIVNFID